MPQTLERRDRILGFLGFLVWNFDLVISKLTLCNPELFLILVLVLLNSRDALVVVELDRHREFLNNLIVFLVLVLEWVVF